MKVYTYYEDVWGHLQPDGSRQGLPENVYQERKLVQRWKQNWENSGFEARVLNKDDAEKHPKFNKIMDSLSKNCEAIRRFPCPSINSKRLSKYGASCFHRWLAYAALNQSEPFYVADYDVFNTSLPAMNNFKNPDVFTSYQWATPSFVKGNSAAFDYFINLIEKFASNVQESILRHEQKDLSSVHDQDLIFMYADEIQQDARIKLLPPPTLISNYSPNEGLTPVIHLSHHSVEEAFNEEYSVENVLKRRLELVSSLGLS